MAPVTRNSGRGRRFRPGAIALGLLALAVIALAVAIWAGGWRPAPEPSSPPAPGWKTSGSAQARVVVREYADFQCPACRAFHQTVLPWLMREYVQTGRVRFEFHHFLVFSGDASLRAAEASECAGEQGRFWDYHDRLFEDQPAAGVDRFSVLHLETLAAQQALDTAQFNACLETSKHHQRVIDEQIAANQLGLPGTPSLFVNGQRVANPFDYAELQAAIEAALK